MSASRTLLRKALYFVKSRPTLRALFQGVLHQALRLVKNIRRLLDRAAWAIGEDQRGPSERLNPRRLIRIETVDDAFRLSMANLKESEPFLVPSNRSVWGYGFRYALDEHPWVAYLQNGGPVLDRFYAIYRPKDTLEAFCPVFEPTSSIEAREHRPTDASIEGAPWLYPKRLGISRKDFVGEDTNGQFMGSEHGIQHRGPVSREKLSHTGNALQAVRQSLDRLGYRPDIGGWIRGYFLAHRSEFLFLVCGGQHRAAAWTALGEETIPVIFQPGYPRIVDAERLKGSDRTVAMAYFDEEYRKARLRIVRDF